MRVGLSAYLLHEGRDYRAAGVSVYTHQLLAHLARYEPDNEYIAFSGRDAPSVGGITNRASPVATWRPLIRIPWEQTALPVQARASGLDILHCTVNVAPLLYRGPTVITVHDLAFLRHPERFSRNKAAYLRVAVGWSVRRSDHVIAVSQSTRSDLIDLLGVGEDRLTVVYPGVDSRFCRMGGSDLEAARRLLPVRRPFILHVGTLEPRKNVDVLIAAFARARRELDLPHALVLAGARGWMYERLFELVSTLRLEGHVIFTGYVAPVDLPLWYNAADLFVYPSAYEGFGLPLLEAMACGAPCVTSTSSALREVAADACLTVEPGSEEDLQVAITRVLTDDDLGQLLRQRGQRRAAEFSWERTAHQTAKVYRHVVDSAGL